MKRKQGKNEATKAATDVLRSLDLKSWTSKGEGMDVEIGEWRSASACEYDRTMPSVVDCSPLALSVLVSLCAPTSPRRWIVYPAQSARHRSRHQVMPLMRSYRPVRSLPASHRLLVRKLTCFHDREVSEQSTLKLEYSGAQSNIASRDGPPETAAGRKRQTITEPPAHMKPLKLGLSE